MHMLNGALCATKRALCYLVGNYQTPEVCLYICFGYTDELSSLMTNGIAREEEQMIVNLGKEVERRRKS